MSDNERNGDGTREGIGVAESLISRPLLDQVNRILHTQSMEEMLAYLFLCSKVEGKSLDKHQEVFSPVLEGNFLLQVQLILTVI